MNIDKKIRDAHRNLANCSVKFLNFVKKNPAALKQSNYPLLDLKDELYKLQPWPTFIDQHTKNRIKEAATQVFDLIKRIPARVFGNDPYRISRYYEIPLDIVRYYLTGTTEEHLENLLARGDFILSSRSLKCLEYNVSANIGGWDIPVWESLYLQTPIISTFLKDYNYDKKIGNGNLISKLLDHVTETTAAGFFPDESEMNIALVIPPKFRVDRDKMELYMNELYMRNSRLSRQKLSGKIEVCEYKHLNIADGCMFHKKRKIHILIEMHHGFVPVDILNVFKSGGVNIYNGPASGLLSNKLNLAILSQNEDSRIFSEKEREVIKKYIPWTRKIEYGTTNYGSEVIVLPEFILSRKDKLVIKPSNAYGGEGVYIGRYVSRDRWQELVSIASKEKNWLVQEYIESSPYLYQSGADGYAVCDAAWGFFILGSEYAGGWLRVLPSGSGKAVINCHQGATVSVIFEITE